MTLKHAVFGPHDKFGNGAGILVWSCSCELLPAAIVRFTLRIYVAVVPYSTFPASSRR